MTVFEIIQLFLGSGGLISIIFIFFRIGKTAQKIETIGHELSEIKADVKEVKRNMAHIDVQIGKLETRVEERTLRTIQPTYNREPAVR